MRARQRHLNPKAAGAYTALDSRFEFSVATGTAISSWVSRTGSNDASQSTSANQPKYTTNAINGQPAILFDGSNDLMTISTSITSNSVSVIGVGHKTSVGSTGNTASRFTSIWNTANNPTNPADFGSTNSWTVFYHSAGAWRSYRNLSEILNISQGYVPTVFGAVLDGSSVTGTINGRTATGTTSATALDSNEIRLGAAPTSDGYLNGYIGCLVYFLSVLTAPMRRRLERGAGYSFKIACS